MNFTTPSNKKVEIMMVSSNYHIEVNHSDAGIHDRVVITDMINRLPRRCRLIRADRGSLRRSCCPRWTS